MTDFVSPRFRQIIALLSCMFLLMTTFPLYAAAETSEPGNVVRVGWYESAYNTKDSAGRRTGYSYEYQRKLAAYTGWTYEYVEGSWNELMEMLMKGEIDIMSDVSYTEDRAEKMLFPSYSMGTEEYYLYISENGMEKYQEDYSFFNGKRIGINKGSIQVGQFKEWAALHQIHAELLELTTTEAESIRMLTRGEIDGYVTLDNYLNVGTIIPVAKIGFSDFYFAVSNSRMDLLEEMNSALSKIQDENRFYSQELYAKFIRNTGANLFLNSKEKKWLSEHGTIRVGYLDDYLAYCAADKKTGKLTGTLKDYLDKASDCFAKGNLNFDSTAYSTVEKALQALKNGEVDCIFPAKFSSYEGEVKGVVITPALAKAALFMVVRIDDQQILAEKKQLITAVQQGDDNCESILKDFFPDWKTITCDDTQECLRAVSEGRADCFLISSYRYNNLSKLCEKYRLTTLDTGREADYCFAVGNGSTELYSILAKTTNIIPETYVDTALTHYFSEDAPVKVSLFDFIRDNLLLVIAILVVIVAMLLLIIVQNRLIKAEKRAKEHRRIADDLSRRVYVDALTSVRNKGGYTDYVGMLQERLERSEITEFAVCVFDCDDLKYINDKYGHDKGDEYLKTATRLICRVFQHSPVFRIGGDEFTSILQNDDYLNREELIRKFEAESKAINEAAKNDWEHVNVSLGMAQYEPKTDHSVEDTACRADQLMYENKRKRKAGRIVR